MATLKHTDSSRKYAFWWDSHISPKNSKWLQENLTDQYDMLWEADVLDSQTTVNDSSYGQSHRLAFAN
ncbi:hypothetical protein C5167_013144 [Papaver somniferum]|uniref:NAB domain-containing protein n=1 Tax=Papaver somniferum TaxID=3469 RepID=A0A4Y7IZH5_PAPSO|nr:hypothetical protein C5167_013144 [Papaver somniferum]